MVAHASMTVTVALLVGATVSPSLQAQNPPPARPPINGGLPSVSPDGRWVAFIRESGGQQDLWVIGADGQNERRLTHTATREGAPQWSRDGREVFFELQAPGPPGPRELRGVAVEGGAERVVLPATGGGYVFSPDGRWLARTVGVWNRSRLLVSAPDGSAERAVTDTTAGVFNLAWSPEGSRIAFARMTPDRSLHIWVGNADGSGMRQLTNLTTAEGRAQWPAWSADGRTIAVQVGRYDPRPGTAHIHLVDVGSGTTTKLAAHDRAYLDETPSWFPDGRIAFQSDRTGRMEIWVMNRDGSGARQLTR